jgi:CSLREA domain-containing protein
VFLVLAGATLAVMAVGFVVSDVHAAASFRVNSTLDEHDANPGDGFCAAASGCTLRAAIEETNALPGRDFVDVPGGTFELRFGRLNVSDSLLLIGAGAGRTIISGGDSQPILRAQTVEALVCDLRNDRVLSYDLHGQLNGTFIESGSGGLDQPTALDTQENRA